jgi:hypothetical protein
MSVLQDFRLGFRVLRRSPIATGVALLSIALGGGMTAVFFTAIKSVLIDPLPYAASLFCLSDRHLAESVTL